MILDGAHGTFVGSQETIFEVRDIIREAIEKIDDRKQRKTIDAEMAEDYLWAFHFIDDLYGLDENQKKYQKYLQKKFGKVLKQ